MSGVGKVGRRTSTTAAAVLLVAQVEAAAGAAGSVTVCCADKGAAFLVTAVGTSPMSRFLFLGGGAGMLLEDVEEERPSASFAALALVLIGALY